MIIFGQPDSFWLIPFLIILYQIKEKMQVRQYEKQAKRMKVFSPPNILSMLKNFYYAFNTSSKYCMGFKPIKNRFFFIDIFLWYNSITFKILKHHFLIMF